MAGVSADGSRDPFVGMPPSGALESETVIEIKINHQPVKNVNTRNKTDKNCRKDARKDTRKDARKDARKDGKIKKKRIKNLHIKLIYSIFASY
jgi:hypothetical protein